MEATATIPWRSMQMSPSCSLDIPQLTRPSHMQVDIGGQEHALQPLAANLPNIHVVDEPTSMCGALWLPYRRDHAQLQQALAACSSYRAVFAHADVVRLHARRHALTTSLPEHFKQEHQGCAAQPSLPVLIWSVSLRCGWRAQ